MPDDMKVETGEEASASHRSGTVERIVARFRQSPAQVLMITGVALALIVLVAYLLWPRKNVRSVAVETPPTVETKHEGEGHDEHSQEGAVEVSDETAELIGLKTEKVANGEIEDTIAAVGKALVAPNGQ